MKKKDPSKPIYINYTPRLFFWRHSSTIELPSPISFPTPGLQSHKNSLALPKWAGTKEFFSLYRWLPSLLAHLSQLAVRFTFVNFRALEQRVSSTTQQLIPHGMVTRLECWYSTERGFYVHVRTGMCYDGKAWGTALREGVLRCSMEEEYPQSPGYIFISHST